MFQHGCATHPHHMSSHQLSVTTHKHHDWLPVTTMIHSLSSLAVAVGGVKECGIFVNEITPAEFVPRSFVIGCAGELGPLRRNWRQTGINEGRTAVRLGCYTEEITKTTDKRRQQDKKNCTGKTRTLGDTGFTRSAERLWLSHRDLGRDWISAHTLLGW